MPLAEPSGNQEPDSIAFRAELRRAMIAARLALPPLEHARASTFIETHLATWLATHLATRLAERSPGTIAFCWPLRNEFDCRPLVRRLLAQGWRACQPVVVAPEAAMIFRPWTPDAPMTADRHGIPIPAGSDTVVPDVVLLPLVAFDAQGYRLGYGGGYFDRTLATLSPRPLALGVGFELARVDSVRPQPHDIRLDGVVTEADIVMPS